MKKGHAYLTVLTSIWLIYESGYGLLQVLGLAHSKHALFSLTGHFQNPGPFGGFIAMLMSICLGFLLLEERNDMWQRWMKRVCFVAIAMGVVLLPASMSRSGWLGLAIAMMVLTFRNKMVNGWFSARSIRVIVAMVVLAIVLVGGFLLKKDSALGRIHIWHMELLAILKASFTGFGKGRFAWAYGETQAAYFSTAERAPWEIRVAGCPEYAFNEYLKAGVEWGIPGFLLLLGLALFVCIILIRKANPLGYGAVVFSVFAFFSYPLSLWPFRLMAGLFVTVALGELLGRYRRIAYILFVLVTGAVWSYGRNKIPAPNYRVLYQQGHAMFQRGAYKDALPLLRDGASLSCDPMFHNIMGRCYEALGEYKDAEKEYLHAHYMVPCRLYPLVLLQELYLSQSDTLHANSMLSRIREMPINAKNTNMINLRKRAEDNSLR